MSTGILYVVATPIGNLEDFSPRAKRILQQVDVIAAEDTRHSAKLLSHCQISTPLVAFHDHNEKARSSMLIERLQLGQSVALISDAGTPLVSDPGFHLIRQAQDLKLTVSPIPGPCAAIAALSIAGLPSDRFIFEGFLPARSSQRRLRLQELVEEVRTIIFYESPHRIVDCIEDLNVVCGGDRKAVIARELTKTFETVYSGNLAEIKEWISGDPNQQKGEFVVLLHGAAEVVSQKALLHAEKILEILVAELPTKQAAHLTARITGEKKNRLYDLALKMQKNSED